ncbi:MAG: group II intron reverse transcriptase/maturase [bacterium]|jgi:RNA-directed DNA polymerase|nr:group II intron reverse transcriptase/maturase [bacterium]
MKPGNAGGAKGAGYPDSVGGQPQLEREEPASGSKPFTISKRSVSRAFLKVKANKGAPGVDEESIAEFDRNLEGNLYKIWNRLSSGSYFPPPVRKVEIPKPGGRGVRVLGVPTVADRVAQTVVAMYLEPLVEPSFHPDSYGYRPGRSPQQAVGVCRERCWRYDWVIDLDIRAFFDNLDHDLVLKATRHHTEEKWILLYVERWLKAPLVREDGSLEAREKGSPQGSAISPLLANLFMHYAFDAWMQREYPEVRFERYADDVVVHCVSEQQAKEVLAAITERLAEVKLEVNPEKTRIVYCRDDNRRGPHRPVWFDFAGHTFRPRWAKRGRDGKVFLGFLPAVSEGNIRRLWRKIRNLKLHLRSGSTLEVMADEVNPIARGWINYYGRYYRSKLIDALRRINTYLVRWAERKFRKLRGHPEGARRLLAAIAQQEPRLFVHWEYGARPTVG